MRKLKFKIGQIVRIKLKFRSVYPDPTLNSIGKIVGIAIYREEQYFEIISSPDGPVWLAKILDFEIELADDATAMLWMMGHTFIQPN